MLHEGSKKTKGKMQNEESESSEACTLCFFSLSLSHQTKNIQISPEKAIFMFVKNVLPPTGTRGGREEKKAGEKRVEGNLCSSS